MCSNTVKQNCFQLKADFLPMTVFKIAHLDLAKIKQQLNNTVQSAPKYFQHAPMIIDVKAINDNKQSINLGEICNLLREQTIIPVGIRGLETNQYELANKYNLAIFNDNKATIAPQKSQQTKQKLATANKIITRPVRSGSQVYAKGGDLIILAAVNAGGECIADGNIHIYGPLRGRALAGASGNKQARIFCQKLDADLVSIAGHYLISDDIKLPKTIQSMIQIYLENESLIIDTI